MSPFGFSTTSEEIVEAFPNQVKGRTFAITGASADGLGAQSAIALARASPAHLILLSRNESKVKPVMQEIASIDPKVKVTFISVSLDDVDSVRKAAEEVNKSTDHIDVLINNAGVMAIPERTVNKQGIELTLATNHIGHFLLTKLLLPKIITAATKSASTKGPQARIINLTSRGHQISPFIHQDPNFTTPQNPYDPWTSYGQSKTANILFTLLLSRSATLKDHSIRTFSVHPGGIFTTGLSTHLTPDDFKLLFDIAQRNTGQTLESQPRKNLTQGASSQLWAALDPALNNTIADPEATSPPEKQGLYIVDCNFDTCRDYAKDVESGRKVWSWSEQVVGEKFSI